MLIVTATPSVITHKRVTLSPNTAAGVSESLPALISQGVFKERDSHPLLKARSISAATRPEALQYIGHT